MTDIAIQVEGLSKYYRIGKRGGHLTLKDSLTRSCMRAFNLFRDKKTGKSKAKNNYIWALKDISFEVKKGEIIGIIGRNGAGKTTLLKILSRITVPTKGYAEINGRVGSLLEVGTGFHPELTGRENIYLNGAILGMKRAEIDHKFDNIVAFAEIEKFLDTPVKRYSSGMYVRLAFAVAAHLEPEILMVDEVLAVGDTAFQKKCLGKMGDVAKEGRTVLFVSHNMAAISNLCKRCILFENGKIVMNDQTETVINHYLSTISESSLISLRHRKDRKGEGRIRFTDTWIEDARGQRISCVRSGDSMKIVAFYEVKKGATVSNLAVAFAVHTLTNIPITDLGNITTGDFFMGGIPDKGRIECYIPKLPLNTGSYSYNVIARSGTVIEDWVTQAGRFDVETGDYFGTGKTPDSGRLIMIDHKWNISNIEGKDTKV